MKKRAYSFHEVPRNVHAGLSPEDKSIATLRITDSPSVVAITEILATDHHLENETATYTYRHELAFSHNYPAILKESGFDIIYRNDRFTKEGEEPHPNNWF